MLTIYYFFTYSLSQFISLVVWWYSTGLWLFVRRLGKREVLELKNIALFAWIKNFFLPMFHDYTIIGRLLSVGFRFFIIIGKLIQAVLGFGIRMVFLGVWLLLPLFIVWGAISYFV